MTSSFADLPEDVVLVILEYLEIWELLRCQLVSRSWKTALDHDVYSRYMVKKCSEAREVRKLLENDINGLNASNRTSAVWAELFQTLACRYYHLSYGRVRSVDHYKLRALDQLGAHWYPVSQWDYHESQPGGRLYHESAAAHLRGLGWKPYLFRPTLWTYDDGIVICVPAESELDTATQVLVAIDLESRSETSVPFEITGRIVRNIRLCEGTLVVEWAEKEPFHHLNLVDQVYRHFVTCYDVVRNGNRVVVKSRSEWKIHFLGLPLSARDYFFSTHTKSYYAVYLWQPNRGLWTADEDQPIEALSIWDISTASLYRPSDDPQSQRRPDSAADGPHVVARYALRDLDFLGWRQHSSIALSSLHLDSLNMSMTVKENTFMSGQGYFDPAERNWCSTSTTFPFMGHGPVFQKRPDVPLPPYRGHCTMDSADIKDVEKWFLPIMDIVDEPAGVRFSLVETCFTGMMMENKIMLRIKTSRSRTDLDEKIVKEIGAMGRIAGDERWVIGQNSRMELVVARFQ